MQEPGGNSSSKKSSYLVAVSAIIVVLIAVAYFVWVDQEDPHHETMMATPVADRQAETDGLQVLPEEDKDRDVVTEQTVVSATEEPSSQSEAMPETISATAVKEVAVAVEAIEEEYPETESIFVDEIIMPEPGLETPTLEIAEDPAVAVEILDVSTDVELEQEQEQLAEQSSDNVIVSEAVMDNPVEETGTAENIFRLDSVPDYVSGVRGSVWFKQQEPGAYVLQLISAQNLGNIENLLKGQEGSKDQLSGYIKYTPSWKPRYLLFYGHYQDRKAAEEAIQGMPADFKKVNPWPRTIGNIVTEIKEVEARLNE